MPSISTKNVRSGREKKARLSFRRIVLLIRVFFKQGNPYANLMASTSRKKKNQTLAQRKRSLMGQRLLMVFMVAYLVFMTVLFSKDLALAYITLGEDRAFFDLLLSFFALTTVFFGFFQTFSYLVFGENDNVLASMPFLRGEILLARLAMIFFYEIRFPLLIGSTAFFTYAYYKGSSWTFYVKVLVTMLLQTMVPVALLVFLTLLLMQLGPLVRNRDHFVLFSQIVLILVIIVGALSLTATQNTSLVDFEPKILKNPLYPITYFLLPNLYFLRAFLTETGPRAILALCIAVLIGLVFLFLAYLLGNLLYHPEAMPTSGSRSKRVRLSGKQSPLKRHSPFWAYFRMEFRKVTRTPEILLNNVMGSFIVLVMGVIGAVIGFNKQSQGGFSLNDLREMVTGFFGVMDLEEKIFTLFAVSLGILVLSHFIVGMSSLNASALSREGQEIIWGQVYPLSISSQYGAKTLLSMLLGSVPFLLIFLAAAVIFKLPWWLVLVPIFFFLWAMLNCNLLELFMDARNPVLDWDNLTYAIKQNKSILWSMLMNWLIAGLLGFVFFLFFGLKMPVGLGFGILFLVEGGISLLLIKLLPMTLRKTLSQLEDYL